MPNKWPRSSSSRRSTLRRLVAVGAAAVLSLPLASTSFANGEVEVVQIVIDKVAFTPLKKPLVVGDIVEFVNNDVVDHTATEKVAEKQKGWDVVIRVGRKARVEMKTAGTIDYYCRFHPNMTGQLTVRPKR